MPQLNFHIPSELLQRIDAQKPKYLDRKGFLCLLLDKALDNPALLSGMFAEWTGGGTGGVIKPLNSSLKEEEEQPRPSKGLGCSVEEQTRLSKEKEKKGNPVFRHRVISPDLVPDDLLDCQELLPEFWLFKSGVRSESVWKRICGNLRGWAPPMRQEALESAISGGWANVWRPKSDIPAQKRGVDWDAVDHVSFFK